LRNDVAVAVVAGEHAFVLVEIDREFPVLEFFARDTLVIALRQGDFVEKPISAAVLGEVLRPVGVKHAAHEAVAIPVFASRELPQIAGAEGLSCRSWGTPSPALALGLRDDDFRAVEREHVEFQIEALAVGVRPCGSDLLPEIALAAFGHRIDLVAWEFACRGHVRFLSLGC